MTKNNCNNSPKVLAKKSTILCNKTIRQAIKKLDQNKTGILLVFQSTTKKFLGTITDGDIRRGILRGLSLNSPLKKIINTHPYVAKSKVNHLTLIEAMNKYGIRQIPFIDKNNKITGLYTNKNLSFNVCNSNILLIMAGGQGSRLRPLTNTCPKPLLPVGGTPILEHIIRKAKNEGFRNIVISVHYLAHMIERYFGNGSKFGVNIKYIREKIPLGTAGAIALLSNQVKDAFICTNADVITDFSFESLLLFHKKQNAFSTMAVQYREIKHPFGIVKTRGYNIIKIIEKPIVKNYINAGVYVFEPEIKNLTKKNECLQIPELFKRIKQKRKKICAFPIYESWSDLGRLRDLNKINTIFQIKN